MLYRYIAWLLIIISCLLVGGLCYLQGDRDVVATIWLQEQLPTVYAWLINVANKLPFIYRTGWVGHHLADIMWSSSFAMIICGIWVNQFSVCKLLLVGIGCAIFYEVLQLVDVARGTFDIFDLIYSLCAGVLATLLTYWLLRKVVAAESLFTK